MPGPAGAGVVAERPVAAVGGLGCDVECVSDLDPGRPVMQGAGDVVLAFVLGGGQGGGMDRDTTQRCQLVTFRHDADSRSSAYADGQLAVVAAANTVAAFDQPRLRRGIVLTRSSIARRSAGVYTARSVPLPT